MFWFLKNTKLSFKFVDSYRRHLRADLPQDEQRQRPCLQRDVHLLQPDDPQLRRPNRLLLQPAGSIPPRQHCRQSEPELGLQKTAR
jgi:hypothetical protein